MRHYRKLAFICLLFTTFSSFGQTESEDPIDVAYHTCLGTDSSESNISMCAFTAYSKWSAELDRTYRKLLRTLKREQEKTALKQAQATWMAHRDAEFKSYNSMFNHPGAKWLRLRKDGQIDIVRARTLQLRNYQESLRPR